MYLANLNQKQKRTFFNLEVYMSRIDGDFSQSEKSIIDAHCMEMHIDNNDYLNDMPLDKVISILQKDFDSKAKRIIFLELVATIIADGVYHKSEKQLVNRLSELLGIDETAKKEAFSIMKSMKKTYERCANYILEE